MSQDRGASRRQACCNSLKSTFKLPLLYPVAQHSSCSRTLGQSKSNLSTMAPMLESVSDAAATAVVTSFKLIAATLGTSLALISVLTKTWHKQLGERFDSFFGVQIEVWLRRPPRLDRSMRISAV